MKKTSLLTPQTMSDRSIMRRLWGYVVGQKASFILATGLMIGAVGLDLVLPILFGEASRILGEPDVVFIRVMVIVIISFICLLASSIVQYIQTMTLQKAGQKIIYSVREQVFTHIERFSMAQLTSLPVGKLVTRITNDTNALNEMFTTIIISLLRSILMIVGILIAMVIISPTLSIYIGLITPLVAVSAFIFRKFSRSAYREVRHNVSNVNAFLSENLSGMKITQVCNQEDKKLKEFQEKNLALRKSSLKEIFVFAIFRPFIYVLYMATIMTVLWVGTENNLAEGMVTYPILLVFYQFVDQLFTPIQRIAEDFNVMQSAFASSERIFETLDTHPLIVDQPDAMELDSIKGDIEFRHVWFKYKEDEWVLKDVSFKINAGETVAFVGATGSGKTTILGLIVRNYEIQEGEILIDGINIKQIKIASLRKHIGQMLQDVFLFSGTIESNIKMREDFTDEEVHHACEYVNAHPFIMRLPKQYQEEVRERGNNFSTGERQLLSFARTIIHRPSVMILDEATANIDAETEVLIQDSLEKMMNIGTMIVVAHRLSTIQHANNIIVLQKGTIIETGTHQELLKNKGHYYKLYQLQYQDLETRKEPL